jgi:acetylglutamate kinase
VTFAIAPPEVREHTLAKARVLLEALPYIKAHAGSTVVVKIGGAAMEDPRLLETFAQDISLLRLVGVRPVIVHGGGPQITAMARRLGIEPLFVNGHRVTDEATLEVVRMVLVGLVNQDLVSLLGQQGTAAVGLSGHDGGLLLTSPLSPELGLVGKVDQVNVELLEHLMVKAVPVIASIGADRDGKSYNVNADLVAGSVAASVKSGKLVYVSDVPGVVGADGELISELSIDECDGLLGSGVAAGGMIPKLTGSVEALRAGVPKVHMIDGRVEHGLILELFTPEGFGTMITP